VSRGSTLPSILCQLITRYPLQDQLAGVGIFTLVAFERNVSQAEPDGREDRDYGEQQGSSPFDL